MVRNSVFSSFSCSLLTAVHGPIPGGKRGEICQDSLHQEWLGTRYGVDQFHKASYILAILRHFAVTMMHPINFVLYISRVRAATNHAVAQI